MNKQMESYNKNRIYECIAKLSCDSDSVISTLNEVLYDELSLNNLGYLKGCIADCNFQSLFKIIVFNLLNNRKKEVIDFAEYYSSLLRKRRYMMFVPPVLIRCYYNRRIKDRGNSNIDDATFEKDVEYIESVLTLLITIVCDTCINQKEIDKKEIDGLLDENKRLLDKLQESENTIRTYDIKDLSFNRLLKENYRRVERLSHTDPQLYEIYNDVIERFSCDSNYKLISYIEVEKDRFEISEQNVDKPSMTYPAIIKKANNQTVDYGRIVIPIMNEN